MSRRKKEKQAFKSKRILPPGPKTFNGGTLGSFEGASEHLTVNPSNKNQAPTLHGYKCTGAWEVKNTNGKRYQFDIVARRIGNVQTLYHGTPARNITAIAAEGLRPGRGCCMFGSGIYLGKTSKAIGYTGAGTARYIIEVKVALGRVWEQSQSCNLTLASVQEAGYHSVAGIRNYTSSFYGTLNNDEYVIYSPDQVLPVRVFEYQSTIPENTYYGACMILKENPDPRPRKSKAWADLYAEKPCGKTAVVKLATTDPGVQVSICKECLERLKLKKGDKIRILDQKNYRPKGIAPITVTIKGRY
jgi:hypothetical protein